ATVRSRAPRPPATPARRASPTEMSSVENLSVLQPQRAPGDLAMDQARCAIELRHDRRQLWAQTPLGRAAARSLERIAPPVPPAGDEAGQWLDDQHAIATTRAFDQAR